jgi:cytochrome c oxidase assembly protein subunit 15
MGWYMVRSGLAERIDVSQYRLALHLSLAILIFAGLLWTALSLGQPRRDAQSVTPAYRRTAALLVGLVFLQIVAGAFVAGLKAGAGYNTWPLMEGKLVPDGLWAASPWWVNLFENATTVQFNHRMLAYALLAVAAWHAWSLQAHARDALVRTSAMALVGALVAQAALGIWTLLAQVPLSLGLAHQAGAVVVFGVALWHLHLVLPQRQG